MQIMNFSLTNIRNLLETNQLNVDELVSQFYRPDLVFTARGVDSVGHPYESWLEVGQLIDDFLNKSNWRFIRSNNVSFNANVAYYAPSVFYDRNEFEILDIINEFSLREINFVFANRRSLLSIVQIVRNNYHDKNKLGLLLSKFNLLFFVNFLFAISTGEYFSDEEEMVLCDIALMYHNNDNDILVKLIKKRLSSLKRINSQNNGSFSLTNSLSKDVRIALIIAGQLRGFEVSIPRFIHKFGHFKHVDAFVSTWENIGCTTMDMIRLSRFLSPEAYDYVLKNCQSSKEKLFFEITKYLTASYTTDMIKNNIDAMLAWCKRVYINIKDDRQYPYNRMRNSEKMYYHNIFWVESLGLRHFSDYDIIIKIRPDYYFVDLTPIELNKLKNVNYILSNDKGYFFKELGFGMGDQIWIGSKDLLPVLKVHDKNSLSYEYMSNFLPPPIMQGI